MTNPFLFIFAIFAILSSSFCGAQPVKHSENKKVSTSPSFTGKILGNKVRLRTRPDLEGPIVRLLQKNDLLLVVDEEGDFWKVAPPSGTKAYVFRTYVLDEIVEANGVNIRLEPHVDAPIIGKLDKGERVKGKVSSLDHKWLEISTPKNCYFYVAKEFVENVGSGKYLSLMEKRKEEVNLLLESAYNLAKTEAKKSYTEMNAKEVVSRFEQIINDYKEFTEHAHQAKDGLALFQENYLQKKIAYLEAKENPSQVSKKGTQQPATPSFEFDRSILGKKAPENNPHQKVKFWEGVENSLFQSWTAFRSGKNKTDFYQEQKVNAICLSGILESCDIAVKNCPGDFILRKDNLNTAYLYSTHIDLEEYVGKEVTLEVAPRPNNHFAFPAYYVLSVE